MTSIESHIKTHKSPESDRGDGLDRSQLVEKTSENENIEIDRASGEPEANQSCLHSSSETFILSNTTIDSMNIVRTENQRSSWLKTYWLSVTIFSSLLIMLMIVLTTILIYT